MPPKNSPLLHNSEAPITLAELNQLEQDYQLSIPPAYRAFLCQQNGGYTEQQRFYGFKGEPLLFQRFLSAKYGDLPLEDVYRDLQELEQVLPARYFIFGLDPFGNCFCIDRNGGAVSVWYHDDGSDEPEVIAPHFEAFLRLFEPS